MEGLMLNLYFAFFLHIRMCELFQPTSLCLPAEEGKEHTLFFDFMTTFNIKDISVEKGGAVVSYCGFKKNCTNTFPKQFQSFLTINDSNNKAALTIKLYNPTRVMDIENENTWRIKYKFEVLNRCKIKVFSRVKDITCRKGISSNGLSINCFAVGIYPEAICESSINLFRVPDFILDVEVDYFNDKMSRDPTYFNCNCDLTAGFRNLIPGIYEMLVSMYPNVTGNSTDKQFATNKSIKLDLSCPALILKECPKVIEINTNIACTCERIDSSMINSSLAWFYNNSRLIEVNERSVKLEIIAKQTMQNENSNFYCKVISSSQWSNVNSTKKYSPVIIAKIIEMNCSYEDSKENVTVSCTSEKVFPAAKCRSLIIHNFTNHDVFNGTHALEKLQNLNSIYYYNVTCSLSILRANLVPGHYDVIIYMYPNVTGNEDDEHFGINKSVSFVIDFSEAPLPTTKDGDYSTLLCVLGANLFLLIAVTFILHYTKSAGAWDLCVICADQKDDLYNYDEINNGYILAVNNEYPGDDPRAPSGYLSLKTQFIVSGNVTGVEENFNCNIYETINDEDVGKYLSNDISSDNSSTQRNNGESVEIIDAVNKCIVSNALTITEILPGPQI